MAKQTSDAPPPSPQFPPQGKALSTSFGTLEHLNPEVYLILKTHILPGFFFHSLLLILKTPLRGRFNPPYENTVGPKSLVTKTQEYLEKRKVKILCQITVTGV